MPKVKKPSRRVFLHMSSAGTATTLLYACAPQVVKETVVVEKVVKETVEVEKLSRRPSR